VIGRVGLALVFPGLNAGALGPLPLNLLAQGSGIINFMRQLGGAFGVISLSVFFEQRTAFHVDALTSTQTPANDQTMEMLRYVFMMARTSAVPEPVESARGLSLIGNMIYSQGMTLAFRDSFLILALVFFICLLPGMMMDNRLRVRS